MKHAHGMNGSKRVERLPDREVRIASLALMTTFVISTFVVNRALGNGVTLETDKASYAAAETVFFSGLGYSPSGSTYEIRISFGGSVVASVGFASDEMGGIPTDVSWAIPFDTEGGTYSADIYNVTDPLNENNFRQLLSSATFEVLSATEAIAALEGNLTDLKELVISNVDIIGINTSLLASLNNSIRKLEAAVAYVEGGNNKTAANQLRAVRNMLTAFVHKVLAQMGKKIDNVTAKALIGNASAYIDRIDSMIVMAELPLGKKMALNVHRTLEKQECHLNRFMVRRGLAEASSDEEYVSQATLTEERIAKILEHLKAKKKDLEGLWADGKISYDELMILLDKCNGEAEGAKELAVLLSNELEASSENKPTLGKHLGPLIQIAKGLVSDSEDAVKGVGQLKSKANTQAHVGERHGHGGDNGRGHNGNGNKGGNSKKG